MIVAKCQGEAYKARLRLVNVRSEDSQKMGLKVGSLEAEGQAQG